jgi:hypothetical protein
VVLVQITTTVTVVDMVEQVVVDRFKRMEELAVAIPTVWAIGLVVPEEKVILVVVLQRYDHMVRGQTWVSYQVVHQGQVVQDNQQITGTLE